MQTIGSISLAIGLLYGLGFGVGAILDPAGMREPIVQSAVVDGCIFAALGTSLLLIDKVRRRKEVEDHEGG